MSDGKKLLASALLTKGVCCAEDATFAEIHQAIVNVPQELVIGVQELPGSIAYDYHYHVDADGNEIHTEILESAGGCYVHPIYHVHSGSSKSGEGCYTEPIYHTHKDSCYSEGSHKADCPTHRGYHSYNCTEHDYHGDGGPCEGFDLYDCGGHRYLSCSLGSGVIGYSLNCGRDNSSIEGYKPACGLVDGQIVGAHIVYDGSLVSNVASYMMDVQEEASFTEENVDALVMEESEKFIGEEIVENELQVDYQVEEDTDIENAKEVEEVIMVEPKENAVEVPETKLVESMKEEDSTSEVLNEVIITDMEIVKEIENATE